MNIIQAKKLNINNNTKLPLVKSNSISYDNWNFKSDVKASFGIGFDDHNIYLSFVVIESNTRAVYTKINDPVYQDSCVEFFISFDDEYYYNFEFNCIGNYLTGYGSSKRASRNRIDSNILKAIKTTPSLGKDRVDIINIKTEWTLDVIIPKSIFIHTKIDSFNNKKAKCNFYKCGDNQEVVHYLSWNPIDVDTPNFHLPEFFGEVNFN